MSIQVHPAADNRSWYAIRVQSRFESVVSLALRGKGYEEFLPVYHARRRWSDRFKQVDLPLFPGYLFCRFDVTVRLPILITTGVVSIVGAGKTPVPVPDDEIIAVRRTLASGLPARPWPFLNVGCQVYVERGPLAGIEGIIVNTDKKYRLILSVPLLQRSVAVEIDREDARPVLKGTGPHAVTRAARVA